MNPPQHRPVRRVLVANRGEVAVRILRACRELGLQTLQVYSEADRDSLAVRLADRAVCIGGARAADSYLDSHRVLAAAHALEADAIHPGYGFLSENADFAEAVEAAGLVFVGPAPQTIRTMGDKTTARKLAAQAGVPTTPGSDGVLADAGEAAEVASRIGYPVLLKAAAGGGGRGMRVVEEPKCMASAFGEAYREAKAAFGDGSLYLEKYLTHVRHIEIQVLGDGETVVQFGERDCSTQRRNQKLIEESPSPFLTPVRREAIGEAALRLCRQVRYRSAGTIECILDPRSGDFYFMEMNTRIQVEHPVTEMVCGVDLVKEQLRIAMGHPLEIHQADVQLHGHAIECRINAEDPRRDFMPDPGRIVEYRPPGGIGVRMDSHLYSGYVVPPHYDSLLGKVICWGRDREEAIARALRALSELKIDGVRTTIDFHRALLATDDFKAGNVHTQYVQEQFMPTFARAELPPAQRA